MIGKRNRYTIIGAGVLFSALPLITSFILLVLAIMYPSIYDYFDMSKDEPRELVEYVTHLLFSFSSIYVLALLIWMLNLRFDTSGLNWILWIIILTDVIDIILLFFISSIKQYEIESSTIYLFSAPFRIIFGLGMLRTNISLYRLKKTYSILWIIGGILLLNICIDGIRNPLMESETTFFLIVYLVYFFWFIIIYVVQTILLIRAYNDKLYDALISDQ